MRTNIDPAMQVDRLDHLVLTVADIDRSVDFYVATMGMHKIEFGEGRVALGFGRQKINLHLAGREFKPNAGRAVPGSADLCFIIATPLVQAIDALERLEVNVIEGPVTRSGACGEILSAYFRDPDDNLIEISNYSNTAETLL